MKRCVNLYYNGCGGNANNFQTQLSCLDFCDSAGTQVLFLNGHMMMPDFVQCSACPTGEEVLVDPRTRNTRTCTSVSGCPSGYICKEDSVNLRSVCCGSTDEGASFFRVVDANFIPYILKVCARLERKFLSIHLSMTLRPVSQMPLGFAVTGFFV